MQFLISATDYSSDLRGQKELCIRDLVLSSVRNDLNILFPPSICCLKQTVIHSLPGFLLSVRSCSDISLSFSLECRSLGQSAKSKRNSFKNVASESLFIGSVVLAIGRK